MESITISRDEYDRLIDAKEDLEDLRAVHDWLANPGDSFPLEVIERLIAGEHPLTVMREWRGLSQNELADKAKVNRIQIGDIESRGKTGSVATLDKLASALGLTVDDLIRRQG